MVTRQTAVFISSKLVRLPRDNAKKIVPGMVGCEKIMTMFSLVFSFLWMFAIEKKINI